MKKLLLSIFAMLTIAATASAMSYEQARNEALFLTDKMAYELNLTDAQYEAAYEINLDYLMGVTSQYDVFGTYWERRNLDLSYVLYSWQWDLFRAATYFYRPLFWEAGNWHFAVYAHYPHRTYFYFGRPHFFDTYRGGHSWRMNGDRSYYHGRDHHYRPERPRNSHFGMRSGWDRGDYRGGHLGTNNHGRPNNPGGWRNDNRGNGNHNNGNVRVDNGNRGNNNNGRVDHGNRGNGNNHGNGGFGNNRGNRGNNDDVYGAGGNNHGRTVGGGNHNNGHSGTVNGGNNNGHNHNGGTMGGSRSRGGNGSVGGGTRGGSNGGASGGNRGGRSNGNGNFGGARR